jgi:hypothetical protein
MAAPTSAATAATGLPPGPALLPQAPTEEGFTLWRDAAREAPPAGAATLRVTVYEPPFAGGGGALAATLDFPASQTSYVVTGLHPTGVFRSRAAWLDASGRPLSAPGPPIDMDTLPAGCVPKEKRKAGGGARKKDCTVQ